MVFSLKDIWNFPQTKIERILYDAKLPTISYKKDRINVAVLYYWYGLLTSEDRQIILMTDFKKIIYDSPNIDIALNRLKQIKLNAEKHTLMTETEIINNYLIDIDEKYFNNKFNLVRILGQGAFGIVYEAVKNTDPNIHLAIKKIKMDLINIDEEITILKILSNVCHNYIVCYKGSFQDDGHIYIITEYLGNYFTLDKIDANKLNNNQLNILFNNLCNGLKLIHSKGVIHRDIKTTNIMYDNKMNIKYLDFGIACYTDCREAAANLWGTIVYIDIAQYRKLMYAKQNLTGEELLASDLWLLGQTIFEILNNQRPLYNTLAAERNAISILPGLFKNNYFQYFDFNNILCYTSNTTNIINRLKLINPNISLSNLLNSDPLIRRYYN